MGKIKSFKIQHSFDERLEESKAIIAKYPDRVPEPYHRKLYTMYALGQLCFGAFTFIAGELFFWHFSVIIEKYSRTDLPDMEKTKYLVPRDMSMGQFIHILSSRLHLEPGKALFVFVNNTLPQTASRMDSIYKSFKDADGFLCMCYSTEKTFG